MKICSTSLATIPILCPNQFCIKEDTFKASDGGIHF